MHLISNQHLYISTYFLMSMFVMVCLCMFLFYFSVVRRKTIYEYHRVSMKDDDTIANKISNETAIFLKALPRCNMKNNCEECLSLRVSELDLNEEVVREDSNTELLSQDYNRIHVTQAPVSHTEFEADVI